MLKPPRPPDEAKRLATLQALTILDTPPEERFNRIIRTAVRLFNVPIALISLVDENRQWFKACYGLEVSETPRDISFCGHAILSDDVLVIPDPRLDERFSDNPLVTGEPYIRFYAGQPLLAADGSRIGTLCIIDRRPRQMTDEDLQSLRDLAGMVESELNFTDLAKLQRAEEKRNRFFTLSLDLLCVAGFDGYFKQLNPIWGKLLGFTLEELQAKPFIEFVHPEDQESTVAEAQRLTTGADTISFENRYQCKDGSYKWLSWNARSFPQQQIIYAIARDITEWKQTEEELQFRDTILSTQQEVAIDGILVVDDRRNWISFNQQFIDMWGIPRDIIRVGSSERALQWVFGKLANPEQFLERVKYLYAHHRESSYEEIELIDGRTFERYTAPMWSDNRYYGRVWYHRDITKRKQMEAELRESEERYRRIVEQASDVVYTADHQGYFVYVNPPSQRLTGYSEAALLGMHFTDLIADTWKRRVKSFYMRQFLKRTPKTTLELPIVTQSGEIRWVEQTVTLLMDADQVTGFHSIVRDITKRKLAEEALRESEARIRAIVNTAAEGIITIDAQGLIESINPAGARIFNYSPDEVIGQNVKILMPDPYHSEHDGYIANYLRTGKGKIIGIDREVVGRRKDGTTFPMDLAVSEVRLGDRRLFTGITRDITERKEIDRMKGEFISTVSHELRTPLTSISGSLGLIAGGVAGELPAQVKTMIDIAHRNSDRLVRLINDILDMEKIESGRMVFKVKPIELMPLVEQAIESNRAYGEQFRVEFMIADALPGVKVNADSDRLMQVFTNLLSNAAKFSPPDDAVVISVGHYEGKIRVTITDHGPGIPAEFQSRIFQQFAQADSSDSRQKGGTGLGLSICKAIVEKLGGQIGYETEIDVGTTFYFDLPQWHEVTEIAVSEKHQPRILICEDDHDIANLLSFLLKQGGFKTDIAYDAASAKRFLAQKQYAVMTLDIGLPDQDGVSLIRELREQDSTRGLPIVVVSAKAELARHEVTNGSAVAIIDWLNKPIDQTRLITAVKQATHRRADSPSRILHIEDDPDVSNVVSAVLKDTAEIVQAANLREAKQKLERESFDLIILDLALPDGNGLDLLPVLQSQSSPLPVVVFSVQDVEVEVTQKVAASLVKSRTSNRELLETIKSLIQQSNSTTDDDSQNTH